MNQTCDLCKKDIPFGNPYIAITYNVENYGRNHTTQSDYINVITSDQILTIFGQCGNKHQAEATAQLLKVGFSQKYQKLN